mmetsp:Transcript_15277/g.22392  ORF Transcript_15277/g.22392 Transcript_15277/m.22392 type:complete len:90 (-) Transcript_15277:774-1043(-)
MITYFSSYLCCIGLGVLTLYHPCIDPLVDILWHSYMFFSIVLGRAVAHWDQIHIVVVLMKVCLRKRNYKSSRNAPMRSMTFCIFVIFKF